MNVGLGQDALVSKLSGTDIEQVLQNWISVCGSFLRTRLLYSASAYADSVGSFGGRVVPFTQRPSMSSSRQISGMPRSLWLMSEMSI